jgi:hypothetical protein
MKDGAAFQVWQELVCCLNALAPNIVGETVPRDDVSSAASAWLKCGKNESPTRKATRTWQGGIVAFIREIELVANLLLLNAHNSTPCVH